MAKPVIPIWIDGVKVPCIEYKMQIHSLQETREKVLTVFNCVDQEFTGTKHIKESLGDWHPAYHYALRHLVKTGQFVHMDRNLYWRRWISPDPLLLPSQSRICRLVEEKARQGEADDIVTLIEVMHDPRMIHDSFREALGE